jgi:hypothetical protein
MRFVVLILALLNTPNLHARESWAWVKFNDTDAGVTAPTEAEAADLVYIPDEPKVVGFAIYFLQKNGCFPIIILPSKQQVTGLQLRIDEGEVHRPPTIKWEESVPIVRASFFQSADPSDEQIPEYVQLTRSFLRDISEGINLRAKLEPSGEVRRWSLHQQSDRQTA